MAQPDLASFLFSFEGRISRKQYLMNFILPMLGFVFVLAFIDGIIGSSGLLLIIVQLVLIWPGLATTVKRWHDRGKSGWMVLISFIPIVGAIWTVVEVWCLRGTVGPNRFGPDPVAAE